MVDNPAVQSLEEFLLEDLARLATINTETAAAATDAATKTRLQERAAELEAAAALIRNDGGANQTYTDKTAEALRIYINYLQVYNGFTKGHGEKTGHYTIPYATYLAGLMTPYAQAYSDLEANTARTPQEENSYQTLRGLKVFHQRMQAVIDAGIYIQPLPSTGENPGYTINQAQPVLQMALDNLYTNGGSSFKIDLNNGFDINARLATQLLLIDMQEFLELLRPDTGMPHNGRYTRTLHDSLTAKLQDPAAAQSIADRYFAGDRQIANQILLSLDVYAAQSPIAGAKSDITSDIMIYKPAMTAHEIAQLDIAIDHISINDLPGTNALFITMTGFGMEDLLPEGALSAEQETALQSASLDRNLALQNLFKTVLIEAQSAAGGDPAKLQHEFHKHLMQRLNTVIDDNPAFNVVRGKYLREYVRISAVNALEVYDNAPSPERLDAAADAFAQKIPDIAEFIAEHGPQNRDAFTGDSNTPRNTPPFMAGTDLNEAQIQAALAGYQNLNLDRPSVGTQDPYFFTIGDKTYVAGIDKNTMAFLIVPLEPDFITMDRAQQRVYTTTADLYHRNTAEFMAADPAYRFLRENYAHRFDHYNLTPDGAFEAMAQALGKTDIVAFLDHPRDFDMTLRDEYAIITDPAMLARIALANETRPESFRAAHYIYLDRETGKILYVSPERDINGLYDPAKPPMVEDISDPAAYMALRDCILLMNILPAEEFDTSSPPAIQEFFDWLERGAPPPERKSELDPANPATPETGDSATRYAELLENAQTITLAEAIIDETAPGRYAPAVMRLQS